MKIKDLESIIAFTCGTVTGITGVPLSKDELDRTVAGIKASSFLGIEVED